MDIEEKYGSTINELLNIEHLSVAKKLNLIEHEDISIDEELLKKSIGMLDQVSRLDNEIAQKVVVASAAILWTYRDESWEGLREFLILTLSRIGFSPSTIMVDSEYDHENYQYSGLRSFFNELSITVYQLRHEINVGDETFLITDFQKKVWEKFESVKLLGVSAPTSAGKSFIILLKVIDYILNHREGNIIYIVPTLSLVSQVSSDFNEYLKRFGISNYRIATSFKPEDSTRNKIYILTQERALSAFSQFDEPFKNIEILVIDEIQNIERVANESDQRSKVLYDTLIEFKHTLDPDITIISGPRVAGLLEFGEEVFEEASIDEEKTLSSPVASFTYAISKNRGRYYLNQYTDIIEGSNAIHIENSDQIKGYGLVQYRNDFLRYLYTFIENLGEEARNIIFSPTTRQARKTAVSLANFTDSEIEGEWINSLIEYLRETVHDDYEMCNTLEKGFVYHHGKTPNHVRFVIEEAIRKKLIPNVVCTTTLMQGVNLPAQNVIMRNPDLAIRKRGGTKPKLTNYEIANLRGRAGRLLKDFIGRTFVLDENAFEADETEQGELFPEAVKEIRAGYGEKFEEHRDDIIQGLNDDTVPEESNKDYSYLMTYVRQTILRHGEESYDRLSSVGIDISQSRINDISDRLNELDVSKEICSKNRYWDPFDLETLLHESEDIVLPTRIFQYRIERRLQSLIQWLKEKFPLYYDRYLGVRESLLFSLSISAKQWMQEEYLKTILSARYLNTKDKVEDRISLLQNKISYGLPLLLKPMYDIKEPSSSFLNFIEMGAYKSITRNLIELNIPRETAIYLADFHFNNSDELGDDELISRLKSISNELGYWRKIQVEQFI